MTDGRESNGLPEQRTDWLFDQNYYLRAFSRHYGREFDAGQDGDAYGHFLKAGQFQGLSCHPLFDPAVYRNLASYDITCRIALDGPFTTFLRHIGLQGLEPAPSNLFDPAWYLQRYPEAAEAVAGGIFSCALHHYLANETPTDFDPSKNFSELGYLADHEDVATAVARGALRNGYAHFLAYGRDEGRRYFPAGPAASPGAIPGITALRAYPLQWKSYSDTTVLPARRDGMGQFGYSFGVLDGAGAPVTAFSHPWFTMRTLQETARSEPRTFIYGGVLMDHFGHVLRDSFSSLWFLRERADLPVLWHWMDLPVPHGPWPGWLQQLWRLVGLDEQEHVFVSAPLAVAGLILPQSGLVAPDLLHERQVEALAVGNLPPDMPAEGRVWLSRRGLPAHFGRMEGEDVLEAALMPRGWRIVRPETLPVTAQVDLFGTAEVVAGCMSSAFHAALLSKAPRSRLLLVERPGIGKPFYDAVARARGLRQHYVRPALAPYGKVTAWTTFALADPQSLAEEICELADSG